jgi:hypothetical protein
MSKCINVKLNFTSHEPKVKAKYTLTFCQRCSNFYKIYFLQNYKILRTDSETNLRWTKNIIFKKTFDKIKPKITKFEPNWNTWMKWKTIWEIANTKPPRGLWWLTCRTQGYLAIFEVFFFGHLIKIWVTEIDLIKKFLASYNIKCF